MKKLLLLAALIITPFLAHAQNDSIGIYYETESGLQKIEPIRYTKTKVNPQGAALSMGIAIAPIKMIYENSVSTNRMNSNPVFYFYYQNEAKLSYQSKYYMFLASDNPSDIVLAKFKKKKKTRELKVGNVNTYAGMIIGTTDDLNIIAEYKKVKEGVYKVCFDVPLEHGEYCFLLNSPDSKGAYMYVFDFSVDTIDPVKEKQKRKERADMYLNY